MPLLLNKINKTKSKNYSFSITKAENIKVKGKLSVKHQANAMNAHEKQLLPKTQSWKFGYLK